MLDKNEQDENKNSKKGFNENVFQVLGKQKQEDEDEGDVEEDDEYYDDLMFGSPKNEFEMMLHRKIFELNKLQTDYRELQLKIQREMNQRLKAEEVIIKLKRQHQSEKKSLGKSNFY